MLLVRASRSPAKSSAGHSGGGSGDASRGIFGGGARWWRWCGGVCVVALVGGCSVGSGAVSDEAPGAVVGTAGGVGTVVADADAAVSWPIAVEPVLIEHAEGPIRGFVATVDLTDPRLEVVVTDPLTGEHDPPEAEALLTPTDVFVADTGCVLGFNANFFRWLGKRGETTMSDIVGLSVSDGRVLSPPRVHGGLGDPAVVFSRAGRARVMRVGQDELAGGEIWDAVAGIGGSDKDATPGTLIVVDGVSHGGTARPGPNVRHPRTAVGVNRDGTALILAVIDGRQPGHSIGITLVELADLMIAHGADDAVNLDGGGSSAFVCWGAVAPQIEADAQGWITNSPSDGHFRPVANSIGLRLDGTVPPPRMHTAEPATGAKAEQLHREHAQSAKDTEYHGHE